MPSVAKAALRAAASNSASPLRRTPSPCPPTSASDVLRPISSNPITYSAAYPSRHDGGHDRSRDRAVASLAQGFAPSKAAFAAAARGLSVDTASNTLSKIRRANSTSVAPTHSAPMPFPGEDAHVTDMDMDIEADVDAAALEAAALTVSGGPGEAFDQREPSSSSHDARLLSRTAKVKTTPDAKRAQNRESAKRFRVAQKKRWAELQETITEKDAEIERLKKMLQEITSSTLASMQKESGSNPMPVSVGEESGAVHCAPEISSLTVAELELFVKLLRPREGEGSITPTSSEMEGSAPLAADIGSLHRVIVSRLDGSVLGVRHQSCRNGAALGGDVGGVLWDHVHSSDSAHLRASVVHAKTMLEMMGGQPSVFSYRRRRRPDVAEEHVNMKRGGKEMYIRMKGCLYPLVDECGEVTQVILAEFIEI